MPPRHKYGDHRTQSDLEIIVTHGSTTIFIPLNTATNSQQSARPLHEEFPECNLRSESRSIVATNNSQTTSRIRRQKEFNCTCEGFHVCGCQRGNDSHREAINKHSGTMLFMIIRKNEVKLCCLGCPWARSNGSILMAS